MGRKRQRNSSKSSKKAEEKELEQEQEEEQERGENGVNGRKEEADDQDSSSDDSSSSSSSESESEESEEEEEEEEEESQEDEQEQPRKKQKVGNVRKVTVVLDGANLETVQTSRGAYELLNCDDHLGIHKKLNKEPADSRPDITHQMLLALLDSPLNKSGHLELFIQTKKNILIQIAPECRIPRTFKRFSGLIVQLLHKMKIRAKDGRKTLLKVIKNPITSHLPPNCRIFAAEVDGQLVDVHDFAAALPDTTPVCFFLGAFAHGNVERIDEVEARLSFSEYPLSGACAASRLVHAFERKWGII